ncbi:unnamed protein product [Rotaria socialis]
MVRSPLDSSQELIILGLAFLWQIVSYLHGLVLKDFKRNNCIKLVSYLFFNMDGKTTTTTWDITVFLNVTNGTFILHREDVAMLRFYLAAYISTTKHFRHIFATNGHPLIMLTFLRVYSNIQLNPMLKRSIKYYCRYCFYITSYTIYITNHYDDTIFTVLNCIDFCVTVVAYAPNSTRSLQLLDVIDLSLPKHLEYLKDRTNKNNSKNHDREELKIIEKLSTTIKKKQWLVHQESLTQIFVEPKHDILIGESYKDSFGSSHSPPIVLGEDSMTAVIKLVERYLLTIKLKSTKFKSINW